MAYKELLLHPRWQRKRLQVLDRDNFRCRVCGNEEENLQVHHIIYQSNIPWDTDTKYLITLCQTCHEREESMKDFDYYSLLCNSGITRLQFSKMVIEVDKYFSKIENQDVNSFDDFLTHINHG